MTPLKRIRLERGITQVTIADSAGIDQSTFSRIENGEAQASADTAAKIADAIGRKWISELHILYPDRYPAKQGAAAA